MNTTSITISEHDLYLLEAIVADSVGVDGVSFAPVSQSERTLSPLALSALRAFQYGPVQSTGYIELYETSADAAGEQDLETKATQLVDRVLASGGKFTVKETSHAG